MHASTALLWDKDTSSDKVSILMEMRLECDIFSLLLKRKLLTWSDFSLLKS